MKTGMLKLWAVILTAGLLLAISGCELTADVMEACLANTNAAKSISFETDATMSMSVMGQPIVVKMQGEGNSTAEPMRLSMSHKQQSGAITVEGQSYAELLDGEYVQYTGFNGQWIKQTLPAGTVFQNPQEAMQIYLEGISSYQKEGAETVAGVQTSKYSAVIGSDALERVLQASGAVDQLTQLGMDTQQAAGLYTGLGDLPVTLWVDEAAMRAVKIEMNLTNILSSVMQKMIEEQEEAMSAEMSVNEFIMSMTITGYDTVESVEIPDEVRQQAMDYNDLLASMS